MNQTSKYVMDAHCGNCHHVWTVLIPKGTTKSEFNQGLLCENCDCGDIRIESIPSFR